MPRHGPKHRNKSMTPNAQINSGWHVIPLGPHPTVAAVRPMPVLESVLEAEVAAIWDTERRARPSLFNGRLFSADRIEPDRIEGHWTEYRRILAQIRRPDLFARLQLRSLAVNGLLRCADGFVLGRRQAGAVYLPGAWQAAPAGSVEDRGDEGLDLPAQLRAELREELGLEWADIEDSRTLLAVEHPGSRVVDVGFLLRSPLRFDEVVARHRAGGNEEYDRLQLVRTAEASHLMHALGDQLLPTARELLGRALAEER
jgi:hypothetical protein